MQVTDEQRLQLVAAALTGILANSYFNDDRGDMDGMEVAGNAIYYADSVICKLRKEDIEGGESSAA